MKYADSIIDLSGWTLPSGGRWVTVQGKPVSVKVTGAGLEVIWPRVEGYFGTERKFRFQGILERRGAAGEVARFEPDVFAVKDPKGTFQKFGRGHLYGEEGKLTIGVTSAGEDDFWTVEIIHTENDTSQA